LKCAYPASTIASALPGRLLIADFISTRM